MAAPAAAPAAELLAATEAIAQLLTVVRAAVARLDAGHAPALLTAEQCAQRLGVEPDTVNGWCRAGRFPAATNWGRAGWRIPEYYLYGGERAGGLAAGGPATLADAGDDASDLASDDASFDARALDLDALERPRGRVR